MSKITLSSSGKNLIEKEWKTIDQLSARAISSAAMPSVDDLERAHKLFFEKEKRDVFYRAVTLLMPLALSGQIEFPAADALEIVLQSWNSQFYRFHPWSLGHHHDIEQLLIDFQSQITAARTRSISSCSNGFNGDEGWTWMMFIGFRKVLGPVGAAKALHVLAPEFFPLWDTTIARHAYGVTLNETGYVAMMRAIRAQEKSIGDNKTLSGNFLKLIDEYNYCRYVKRWLSLDSTTRAVSK